MALVVLALAASMISNQVLGSAPVTMRYSTFTGGFGMIVGGIGAAALYLTFIPTLVPIALDALAGLFFLGGLIVRVFLLSPSSFPYAFPVFIPLSTPQRMPLSTSPITQTTSPPPSSCLHQQAANQFT
jgi:hypothetical protein